MDKLFAYQDIVLKKLGGQIDDFYLAGGTALAKFYFHHRESYDLDFFTQAYSPKRITEIADIIFRETGKKLKLVREQRTKKIAKQRIYDMELDEKISLKIDFVEDVLPLTKPFKKVDGVNILSQEDIYLRKIYAVSGSVMGQDKIGRKKIMGGRQEAKDLYDLYILSTAFRNLSVFAAHYCDDWMREGIIVWFRSFNRVAMKTGLLEINTPNTIEFAEIDRHFRSETNKLIEAIT